ncbi:MAG: glycine--tRNA ligase subunit beta [Alphaproteobacteria bacterium]|nr:glycine--tRNA ligase subunit beta [Alphaproteobacteria bacterium]
MSDLLIELFQEEIPARMQVAAEESFERLVTERLKADGIAYETCGAYSTPRRIALHITGLPAAREDVTEELKGPSISAPEQALAGFLKKAGLASADQLTRREIKGTEYYFYESVKKGGPTIEILGSLITDAIANMSWPKSMRWGHGTVRWVRPFHSVVALFDGKIVEGEFAISPDKSIKFGNITRGHRFMGSKADFEVNSFADYRKKLEENFVLLDRATRKKIIWDGVCQQAAQAGHGYKALEDEKLLEEVVGLVEWPVPFLGSFDQEFLRIPQEVITTSMRENQRYFSVLDNNRELSNHFICVANVIPDDDGKTIIHGNQKVLRARLSDARFFWEQDLKHNLEIYLPRLEQIRFHEKLGMMSEKVARLEKLAAMIAEMTDADLAKSVRAAHLCKADLVTGMVREFPELQGVMGAYYARGGAHRTPRDAYDEGLDVSTAIHTHYSPAGPNDSCPTAPVSVVVALADKIDTLVGFFSIGEKPTGSKDPFALRRAALGIIRLIIENRLTLDLTPVLKMAASLYNVPLPEDIEPFILDRFKVLMKGKDFSHNIIEAVTGDTLLDMKNRIEQISEFLDTDKGMDFVSATKRAINILENEEKKSDQKISQDISEGSLIEPEEKELYRVLISIVPKVQEQISLGHYDEAMSCLAGIKDQVDLFFDKVVVNDNDPDIRANRLAMLSQIRKFTGMIADFSRL